MLKRTLIPIWIGVILLAGMFLMGQDYSAQTNLCDPDPCEGIENAVPGSCMLIPGGVCQPDDFTCQCAEGYTWQPATKTCQLVAQECEVDADCDDGNVCNGIETCVAGVCQAGIPLDCDDGNVCTDDTCDPGLGCLYGCTATGPEDPCCQDPACAGSPVCAIPGQSLLPDTGITKCYNMTSEIPCPTPGQPFYGQDAHYIINPMSYTDHGNGTVTDNVTGLMWQKCSAGLSGSECSAGTATAMNWDAAIAYCDDLSLAGHTDWRLPDRYELHNIVDAGRYGPAIDTAAFPATVATGYWSSSTYAPRPNDAWVVNFFNGYVDLGYKPSTYYVRCAR